MSGLQAYVGWNMALGSPRPVMNSLVVWSISENYIPCQLRRRVSGESSGKERIIPRRQ